MTTITEAEVEQAALEWLSSLGWQVAHGPDIAPDTPDAERADYGQVVLQRRLRDTLAELNPRLPAAALDDAFRKLTRPDGSTLEARNREFHRMLVNGVEVEYREAEGRVRGDQVRVIDFDDPANNDWLAVNQLTVTEDQSTRRPDVVLFVNGLPLGIIELKNPADEDATIWTAYQQLQTYKSELPTLFSMNEALVVSDGNEARIGTLTSGREWFKPWRTITGETLADPHMTELQVMLEGVFHPRRFLALVRDFIVFEDDGSGALVKKMAGYHQFHAVRVAVDETLRAAKAATRRVADRRETDRLRDWQNAGRRAGRPPHRGRMAHPGLRQEPHHGLLHRRRHPRARDGESDRRGPHRPQRPGRPAFRHLLPLPGPAASTANPGGQPRRPAEQAVGECRRRGLHDYTKILPRGEGRHPSHALE